MTIERTLQGKPRAFPKHPADPRHPDWFVVSAPRVLILCLRYATPNNSARAVSEETVQVREKNSARSLRSAVILPRLMLRDAENAKVTQSRKAN